MSQSLDPFHPPREPSSVSYTPGVRPTGVTVFAILNILFGVMGIFGIVASAVFMFIGTKFAPGPNPVFDMLDQNPVYAVYLYVSMGLGSIFTILLIVSGVGLLKMSETARMISLAYAAFTIVNGIVGTAINLLFVFLPMLDQANMAGGQKQIAAIAGMVGGLIGGMVGMIYPIAILIYFLRPSVKEAFRNWEAE